MQYLIQEYSQLVELHFDSNLYKKIKKKYIVPKSQQSSSL